jgi:hypothetical protein
MKKLIIISILCSLLTACNSRFEKKSWLKDNDITKMSINNPRSKMISDIMNNYLKKGMSKNQVIELLGDSEKEKKFNPKLNEEFFGLSYLIGPTLADYKFLIIKLDEDDYVIDYWIVEN